jgi:hypothetical protein
MIRRFDRMSANDEAIVPDIGGSNRNPKRAANRIGGRSFRVCSTWAAQQRDLSRGD